MSLGSARPSELKDLPHPQALENSNLSSILILIILTYSVNFNRIHFELKVLRLITIYLQRQSNFNCLNGSLRGWRGRSVSKVLATRACGPEFHHNNQ